jgi:ABC-type lipoprotein export system ATPase subunit
MDYEEGATWRKWDLQVHTPDSIVHDYGGTKEQQWDAFIDDLSKLPPEFKVIGINDYLFLDGYRKVLAAAAEGKLPNIDLFLPVIELRLDRFGGTDKHFSRVNCHVLFSDRVTPDLIEAQFLSTLRANYKLAPEVTGKASEWRANPTRESLTDLGRMIIESIPLEKRQGDPSPLHLGFSNINFSMDEVRSALETHYMVGHCLIAIGKVEWADIKWTDQLIAEKKHIINSADLIFSASASPAACIRSRDKLKEEGVKDILLDCSDAHALSTAQTLNKIGNCFTWIKADTTFAGLRQALREYRDRVYIGDEPPKLGVVRAEGARFIKSVGVHKKGGAIFAEKWFDFEIPLHSDLVAVIGRKGSGKSALTDVIGLLSDSHRDQEFSFLNAERFRLPRDNKARHFEATLTFQNGTAIARGLEETVDRTSPQRVNYIPQHFFERLCGDIAKGGDTDFQAELEAVIFSRLDDAAQLGQRTLRDIIKYRTEEILEAASIVRDDLRMANARIAEVERRMLPEHASELAKQLLQKQQELKDHESAAPVEVSKPTPELDQDGKLVENDELAQKIKEREVVEGELKDAEIRTADIAKKLAAIGKIEASIGNLKERLRREEQSVTADLALLGISWVDIVALQINSAPLVDARAQLTADRATVGALLADSGERSLRAKLGACIGAANVLQEKLNEPQRKYQAYLEVRKEWEAKKAEIVGDEETPGSISDLEALLKELGELPAKLGALEETRMDLAGEVYEKIAEVADLFRELYRPVQSFVDRNAAVQAQLGLSFDVHVKNSGFEKGFLDRIRRNVKGSFSGSDGPTVLKAMVDETDFGQKESALGFLGKISTYLHNANGDPNQERYVVSNQVREKGCSPEELYQYIFGMEYLQPQYTLAMGAKPLNALSPGERGALLLIFYLLVDNSKTPVVLDQPDENLDNETVFELLVPCIREAKKHRQVIVVTHNPNIAVVCDADQIVYASIDKADGNRVTYETGAIENPQMNRRLVDVLEGTRPAFDDRDDKYLRTPEDR